MVLEGSVLLDGSLVEQDQSERVCMGGDSGLKSVGWRENKDRLCLQGRNSGD